MALFLVVATACGDDRGGDTPVDAARTDAATVDGATIDAPAIDAPAIDAPVDAPADAAVDAPIDAPPTPTERIAIARATADGSNLMLPIESATVTYLKPQIGSTTNDPAGFTIQVAPTGPALFVAVDPSTLTPAPVVGDVVSFTITTLATTGGQKRATAITNFMRASQGADIDALAQTITGAGDVVSALDSYDSEVIKVTGSIVGTFASAGSMFESAAINTTGLTGNTSYKLRVPAALRSALDIETGCTFTLTNTPVGRFNAEAQLAAYRTSDITLSGCAAPTLASALALSPTLVQLTFTRNVLASSIMADGSQFTFDNGLTASMATVSGRTVTLTTSAQTGGTTYTVTVASSVTDLQGTAVGTPSSRTFAGFLAPAVVRINEINANIGSGCDLIELRVISGGSMAGFKLQERVGGNNELSYTFGNLVVATNDFIVVHTTGGTPATCNPGSSMSETTSVNQYASATYGANFDSAWDVYATDDGLTATDNVFTVYSPTNTIMDAVLVDDDTAPTQMNPSNVATPSETQAAAVVAATQWRNDDGSVPAGGYVDDVFRFNAVLDSNNTGTTRTGTTMQRVDNTDDNNKADWTTGAGVANTWGALNAGQTAL